VSQTDYKHLKLTRDGNIATVTFSRPEAKNAVNKALQDDIIRAFTELDADDGCDVIVLTGEGDCFCGGGDLDWVLTINGDLQAIMRGMRRNRKFVQLMLDFEKPVIAKIRGAAVGFGCTLAVLSDFVYATPDAMFVDPHVKLGMTAGDGGALIWPQLVGYARAKRYLLTGDPISGAEAAAIGLITEAVPDERLDGVVATMAARLAAGAQHGIRGTKVSLNAALKANTGAAIDLSGTYENLTLMSDDFRIGCEAFLHKKKPKFTGK
jgi:enoyl-CoA hydratase